MTDDKPSIAELQRKLEAGGDSDRWAAIAKAAPVFLEIAAAALALREQEVAATKLRHVLRDKYAAKDADYAAVDAADSDLFRRKAAYDTALSKVRP